LLCFIIASTRVTSGNGKIAYINFAQYDSKMFIKSVVRSVGSAILAQGISLVAIIYAMVPICGGQLNPAVTLGLWLRNKMNMFEALYSILGELIGAVLAGKT
jgi:glycerol uptake facilitator-like aquaporin